MLTIAGLTDLIMVPVFAHDSVLAEVLKVSVDSIVGDSLPAGRYAVRIRSNEFVGFAGWLNAGRVELPMRTLRTVPRLR